MNSAQRLLLRLFIVIITVVIISFEVSEHFRTREIATSVVALACIWVTLEILVVKSFTALPGNIVLATVLIASPIVTYAISASWPPDKQWWGNSGFYAPSYPRPAGATGRYLEDMLWTKNDWDLYDEQMQKLVAKIGMEEVLKNEQSKKYFDWKRVRIWHRHGAPMTHSIIDKEVMVQALVVLIFWFISVYALLQSKRPEGAQSKTEESQIKQGAMGSE
jgi:hypothetical protein